MKRLFCVKNGSKAVRTEDAIKDLGRDSVNLAEVRGVLYFSNKMEAKVLRDFYNQGSEVPTHTIALGPDHIGPHGNKTKFMAYKSR